MSAENDMIALYSQRILALAADIPLHERLPNPDASSKKRSPLCGSTITVDVILDDAGKIAQFGQNVRACALGQASAALFAAQAIGRNEEEVFLLYQQLNSMLQDNSAPPVSPFEGYELLRPAHEYKNRHASIMLVVAATLEAIKEAKKRPPP